MPILSLFVLLTILFVNLWGSALAVGWYWRNRWLALALGPLLFTTLAFGVECHVGLGAVSWLLPLTTILSVAAIYLVESDHEPRRWSDPTLEQLWSWRDEFRLVVAWPPLTFFAGMFGYAFLWRYTFPDIDGSSEKLSDLSYICSYLPGGKIPVLDAWLAPYQSTQYYSFQHYAAALFGRMFALEPGFTYNLSFCVLIGLTGLAFAGAVVHLASKFWVRALVIFSFIVGGTGASPILRLFYNDPMPWTGMRFIGCLAYNQAPLGMWFQEKYLPQFKHQELPGEPFSYSIFLGDYHPPISGYYMLGIGVLAAFLFQRTRLFRYALIVGGTVTWSALMNTWSMPLQIVWIGAWALWNFGNWARLFDASFSKRLLVAAASGLGLWLLFSALTGAWSIISLAGLVLGFSGALIFFTAFVQSPDWRRFLGFVVGGAVLVWFASFVYITAFINASADYKTAIRLVPADAHTPTLLFLLYLLPTIGLVLLSLYSGKKVGVLAGLGGLFYLLLSEFIYIDDAYVGDYDRFNTTLKWWPWITAAVWIYAGPLVLEHSRRTWVKILGALLCLYPCWYAKDLARHWWLTPKASVGQLEGTRWLKEDEAARYVLARLKLEPKGVVVERPNKDSYTNSSCLPLFAGHRMWCGWVGHEQLWHGFPAYMIQRQERLFGLYKGEQSNPVTWLRTEGVDYVLWYQKDDTKELWEKLNPLLSSDYTWCDLWTTYEGKKVGFWRRNGAPFSK